MALLFKLIFAIILTIGFFWTELTMQIFLGYPFSLVNALLIFAIGILLFWEKNFWLLIFLFGIGMEFFSSLPFGVFLYAWIFAMTFAYWLITRVFTSRSSYIVFFVSFLAATVFFIIRVGIHSIFILSSPGHQTFPAPEWRLQLLSITLTALLAMLLHGILVTLIKRLNPTHIKFTSYYGR